MELDVNDVATLIVCVEFFISDYIDTLDFSERLRNLRDANSAIKKLKFSGSNITMNEARVIQASLLLMQVVMSESGMEALPSDPINQSDIDRLYPLFEVL